MADQTPQDPQDPQEPNEEQAPQPPAAEEPTPAPEQPSAEEAAAAQAVPQGADAEDVEEDLDEEEEAPAPRQKPLIPGADLEVDIVMEGDERERDPYAEDDEGADEATTEAEAEDVVDEQPIAAQIQLAADARYRATGKRKTAIARVMLKPGTGAYTINGRAMDEFFPRATLQRTIRQPLEAVGYEDRMDVVARMHGGGVSAQAGALRHGISRALLEADPNLRSELKRRGFLTRDARAKERKKAGLKKARKRPQFSKR
jgi:small subunit ribosomal protein S9